MLFHVEENEGHPVRVRFLHAVHDAVLQIAGNTVGLEIQECHLPPGRDFLRLSLRGQAKKKGQNGRDEEGQIFFLDTPHG